MPIKSEQIGVIGGGAWGSALAQAIALGEHRVLLWAKESSICKEINKSHTNSTFLPNLPLAETVDATTRIEDVAKKCKLIFIACPAQFYTEVLTLMAPFIQSDHKIVICSKGLRESDGALMSDVVEEILPKKPSLGVLAGPAFAIELAEGKPCMLVIASKNNALIESVNNALNLPSLRLYHHDDIIGAQIGGALKNVISITAGIAEEMQLGESVRAAIICRGIKEMERYTEAFGGNKETIYGLAGLGDVVLTAHSPLSRNFRFGREIGKGLSMEEALEAVNGYVEGLKTARIVTLKALSQGVDLGIIAAIDGIVHNDVSAEKVVNFLLQRPRTHEWD